MTLSIDDLARIYFDTFSAELERTDGAGDCELAGIIAVVTALRDELVNVIARQPSPWIDDGDVCTVFNEILAARGAEAAGGSTREDGRSAEAGRVLAAERAVDTPAAGFFVARTPELDAMFAAPDVVCEWGKQDNGFEHTTSCGLLTHYKPLPSSHCHICNKPIRIVEAAR